MSGAQASEQNDQPKSTGSPQQGEPLYLVVGQIRKPHGLKGEVLFEVMTDFPERLQRGKRVYIGDEHTLMTIIGVRSHNKGLLVSFRGKETPEDVESLRNEMVYVKTSELPSLPKGEYYFHQMVGLQVYNEQEELLGELTEILETGANDVYVINTPEGKELLVPAIESVLKLVDLDRKRIVISPPEWD